MNSEQANCDPFLDILVTGDENQPASGPSSGQDLEPPTISLAQINTLKKENVDALCYIQTMENQLSGMNTRMLQMENRNSSGNIFLQPQAMPINFFLLDNSSFLLGLTDEVKSALAEGFHGMELQLLSKIRTELRAELLGLVKINFIHFYHTFDSHTDQILEGIGSLDTIKGLSESTHTNVEVLKEWVSDLSESVSNSHRDLQEKIGSLASNPGSLGQLWISVEKVSKQLNTLKTIVINALQV
jgi:hypothetical protein